MGGRVVREEGRVIGMVTWTETSKVRRKGKSRSYERRNSGLREVRRTRVKVKVKV